MSKLNKILNFDRAIGIDLSEELIKLNKDPNIELEIGDAEKDLRFEDSPFDIAINSAVIEHLDNPRKMMAETHRVLKDHGILIITTPPPHFGLKSL